jgi:hypothetical protein
MVEMKKGTSIIGVRSEVLHARVSAFVAAAKDENVTRSSVVRIAVREYLDRMEAAQKANTSDPPQRRGQRRGAGPADRISA